jgi:hypothetical protein
MTQQTSYFQPIILTKFHGGNNMLVRKSPRQALFILLIATLTLAACNVGSTPAAEVDVNAINTAALATAMAQISSQQTQTALAAPSATPQPTDTPLPVNTVVLSTSAAASPTGGALPTLSFNTTPNTTPLAGFTPIGSPAAPVATTSLGDACNNLVYIADTTIPDGTVFDGGEDFEKIWRVQNTGSCKWDEGYKLVFIGGNQELDPVSVELRAGDFVDAGETADLGVDLTAPLAAGNYTASWRMQSDNGVFFGQTLTVVIEVK